MKKVSGSNEKRQRREKEKKKTSISLLSYLLRQQLQVGPDARQLALELPARIRRRSDAALGGEAPQALLLIGGSSGGKGSGAGILDVVAGELHDAGSGGSVSFCCFYAPNSSR